MLCFSPLPAAQNLLPTLHGERTAPAYLVGVPEADGAAERQLPHQQVVHPAEGELQVFDLVLPKVVMYLL